jgi:ABC-type transport system involved in cytochrome bd biosynthesis fused ATPase/permease subunit
VFQDFLRLELPLRDNVAPGGAPDQVVQRALESAGAADLARLATVLARGYDDGTELSGGQWQRVALARALCSVATGAGVVLLDEPTAQLDVRGESEIFDRIRTRHDGARQSRSRTASRPSVTRIASACSSTAASSELGN